MAAGVAVISLFGACSDPLRPADFAGTYVLRSIAGDPVPAVLFESPGEVLYVTAERLEIEGASGATIVRELESQRPTSPGRRYSLSNRYSVRVEGDHLVLLFVCPPNALCTADLPSYRAYREANGGLRIEGFTSRGPMLYERAFVLLE